MLPFGYEAQFMRDAKGERIKGTGRAVFSADQHTARQIFEFYATGNYSDLTLAEALNVRGLTAIHKGKRVPFSKFTTKSILTNPFYIGIIRYRGAEYPGAHTPLIDRALWDQCQAIRARRAASGDGVPRCGRVPVRGTGGLLSEIVFCAHCGGKLHTLLCGEGASRQRYYRCGERRKYGRAACDAKMIAARTIESQIFDVLRRLTIPPMMRDAVMAVAQERLIRPITPEGAVRAW